MSDAGLDEIAGPRTLTIFAYLLMGVVLVIFIGAAVSILYDIDWPREIGLSLANQPGLLFSIAGFLATIILIVKGIQFLRGSDF